MRIISQLSKIICHICRLLLFWASPISILGAGRQCKSNWESSKREKDCNGTRTVKCEQLLGEGWICKMIRRQAWIWDVCLLNWVSLPWQLQVCPFPSPGNEHTIFCCLFWVGAYGNLPLKYLEIIWLQC